MKRSCLAGLVLLGVCCGPAVGADEEALVAWLLKDGAQVWTTGGRYIFSSGSRTGIASLIRSGDGFLMRDGGGQSAKIYRVADGYWAASGALLPDGLRIRRTADGGMVHTTRGYQGAVRRMSSGYHVAERGGRSRIIPRPRDGFLAPPGAGRTIGLGAAFDAARERKRSK